MTRRHALNTRADAMWAADNYGDGSYLSPGGGLGRVDAAWFAGAQQISCAYRNKFPVRLANFTQFNVYIHAPRGARVQSGAVLTRGATATTTAGSVDMLQLMGVTGITLTVTGVVNLSDGSDFLTYTFTTSGNTAGYTGTMMGTGQCVVRYP